MPYDVYPLFCLTRYQLSGLALTLGASYLTLSAHRAVRRTQSTSLRQQTYVLNALVDPQASVYDLTSSDRYAYKRYRNLQTLPPSRLDPVEDEYSIPDTELRLLEEDRRKSILDMSKEGWNREVEGFVRKVYTTDWRAFRERMERGVAVTWNRLYPPFEEKADPFVAQAIRTVTLQK